MGICGNFWYSLIIVKSGGWRKYETERAGTKRGGYPEEFVISDNQARSAYGYSFGKSISLDLQQQSFTLDLIKNLPTSLPHSSCRVNMPSPNPSRKCAFFSVRLQSIAPRPGSEPLLSPPSSHFLCGS